MLATLVAVTLARPSLRAGKAEFVDVSEPLELLDPELLDAELLDVESLDAELLDAVAEWLYENHTEAIDENETEAIERKLASEDVTYYASRDHELCMIQNGAKNKQCFARRIGYGAIDVVNADRNTSEFKKGWSQIMISEDLKKMACHNACSARLIDLHPNVGKRFWNFAPPEYDPANIKYPASACTFDNEMLPLPVVCNHCVWGWACITEYFWWFMGHAAMWWAAPSWIFVFLCVFCAPHYHVCHIVTLILLVFWGAIWASIWKEDEVALYGSSWPEYRRLIASFVSFFVVILLVVANVRQVLDIRKRFKKDTLHVHVNTALCGFFAPIRCIIFLLPIDRVPSWNDYGPTQDQGRNY
jgi:hypothetical protein